MEFATAELLILLRNIYYQSADESGIAKKAQKFIHHNYKKEISVEYIAKYCNVSVSYLHKVYSKTFALGSAQALLNHRIAKAKDLLINTSYSLNEIAKLCGFNSQSYFSGCFKRKVGASPKEFRNNSSYV